MTTDRQEFDQTIQQIDRVVLMMSAMDRRPHDFGTGDVLYRVEIHTLQAVGDEPGINVTALAQRMAVTKGAVSQTIAKLIDKKLVRKEFAPGSNRDLALFLTDRGQVAYRGHEDVHYAMAKLVREHFGPEYKDKLQTIRRVFAELAEVLKKIEIKRD